jgi:hypothetical protein
MKLNITALALTAGAFWSAAAPIYPGYHPGLASAR